MIWIAIVDNSMGMLFNHRRQSRDRVLVQRILEITRGHAFWMSAYTAALFEPLSPGGFMSGRPQVNLFWQRPFRPEPAKKRLRK